MGLSRSKRNNIKNQWLAVLFTFIPVTAFSATTDSNVDSEQDRWFQVELIIFAHNNKEALESEDWPKISGLSLPEPLVELTFPAPFETEKKPDLPVAKKPAPVFEPVTPLSGNNPANEQGEVAADPASVPIAFEMLPNEEMQLNDDLKRLSRSRQFEPLLHVAWRQPTLDKDHAQTVLLYDGMTEPVAEPSAIDGIAGTDNEDTSTVGPPNPRVIGTVRLSVARYLHLAADLLYRVPVTEQVAIPVSDLDLWDNKPYPTLSQHQGPAYQLKQWETVRGFRLEESRRMRSKKIHYLDNPFFGIVVLVTPVELPTNPEIEDTIEPSDPPGSIPSPVN